MRVQIAATLIAACCLAPLSIAQDETPTKVTAQNRSGELPFSTSIGTQIEHVDVASAVLNVTIPLIKVPGRGMNSEVTLHWNSNMYVMAPRLNGLGNPFYIWNFDFPSGWQTNSTFHRPTFQALSCTLPVKGSWSAYTNYIYTDPAGTKHPEMVQTEWGGTNTCAGPGNPSNPDLTGQGMWATTGGSGSAGYNFTVLNADGSLEDLQDSNGNQENNESGLDTLGRQFVTGQTTRDGNGNITQQTYVYTDANGSAQTYTVNWQLVTINTAFSASTCGYGLATEITGVTRDVVTSIVLPNQQQYVFRYDPSYGEINEIDLPTGGVITYQWGTFQYCRVTRRYVTSRTETVNGVASTWTFSLSPTTYADTITYPTVNGVQNQSVFTSGVPSTNGDGAITDAKIYSGSAQGTPLREYVLVYASDHDPHADESCYNDVFPAPADNAQAVGQRLTSITTILENGQQKQTQFDYETFTYSYYPNHCTDFNTNNQLSQYTTSRGNVTEIREYDWGQGGHGGLIRRTDKTYLHNSNSTYLTYNIVDKVLQETVFDNATNPGTCQNMAKPCAQTQYEYDVYTPGVNALISTSGSNQAPQHDYTHYPSTFIYRGNVTRVKRFPNTATGSNPLTTTYTYDDLGNIRAIQDQAGNTTSYSYLDAWSGSTCPVQTGSNGQAYVTQMTDALNHQVKRTYYQCTGALEAHQDQNDTNATRTGTQYSYDRVGRVTLQQDTHLTGDTSWGSTTNTYNDVPPITVTTSTLITTTPTTLNKISVATEDGLGRVIETQLTSDPDGTTEVDTAYDALGRKSTVSNPYRPGQSLPTDGTSTTTYDALSRVTLVSEPDGSSVTTTYAGNCTTVTDEAQKKRTSCSDGLGRMTGAWEDPSTLNYETDYVYDALGNMLSVTQKGTDPNNPRPRTFAYDAMSRLTSANNPESGIISYSYTKSDGTLCAGSSSAVCYKLSPLQNQTLSAQVTTTYAYDQVNRLNSRVYTGTNFTTPQVSYGYDGITPSGCSPQPPTLTDSNPVYHRTSMCDGSGATSWSHDQMARIAVEKRTIKGLSNQTKSITYTYNLDSSLSKLTYPGTSKNITFTPGGAGRPTAAKDTGGNINYVTGATYAPFGGLVGMTNGVINVADTYNDRLQPLQMYVTTNTITSATLTQLQSLPCPTAPATVMSRSYNFAAGTNDNGNVQSFTNCLDSTRTQTFTYDSLNRIATAQSSGSGSTSWGEQFTIDSWSNLTSINPVSGKTNHEPLNCGPASTKNQLTTCYGHDSAGNLMQNGSVNYTYDAENRLVWSSNGYEYIYDGDGSRVVKCTSGTQNNTCQTGSTGTLYWRYSGGDTIAENSLGGTNLEEYIFLGGKRIARRDVSTNAVHYYFSDHLGSISMVENATGTACEQDIDYYPYGGVEHDYCPNVAQNYKFTGKERDTESGLDNFGARYNASSMGRFMTPDPLYIEAHRLADPQRLNLYAYARNNPVTLSDLTGLDVTLKCDTKKNCAKAVQDFNSRKGAQFKVELGKDGKLQVVKGSIAKGIGGAEGKLLGAINDSSNHATINVSGNTGQSEFGTHDSKGVNSVDLGNLSKLDAASNAGGLNSGDALAHEAMDAYYSLSMGEEAADQAAAGLYPGLYGPTGNQNSLNQFGTAIVGSSFNQAITNGSGTEHVTIQYITPIPAIDLFGKSPAARNDIAHDAGSRTTGVTFVPPKQQ
jgi:RHS repeat-associated protein